MLKFIALYINALFLNIVKNWNKDKFLFSFYFCLFSFSYGIIKTGKSKKK